MPNNALYKVIATDQDAVLSGFKVSKLMHNRTKGLYYLVDLTPPGDAPQLRLNNGALPMEVQEQHLSIFETHADENGSEEHLNSTYHFTLCLRNSVGITYKAHIYFNRHDQFSVMSQLLRRDTAARDLHPIYLSRLDQQALFDYSLPFIHSVIKPLRLAQATLVARLQGTYQTALNEINTLMLGLPENRTAVLKMLDKAWYNLIELCEYDSRKAPYYDQKRSLHKIRLTLKQPVTTGSFYRKSKTPSPVPTDTPQSEHPLAVVEASVPVAVKKTPSPTSTSVDSIVENAATAELIEEYNFFYHRAQRTAASYVSNHAIIINALKSLLEIESKVLKQILLITDKSLIAQATACRLRTHILFSRWSTDPQFLAAALDFAAEQKLLELVPFPNVLAEQAFDTDDLSLFIKLLKYFSPGVTERFTFSKRPEVINGYTLVEWCCALNKPKFIGPLLRADHSLALFIVEGSPVIDMIEDLTTYPRFIQEIANHWNINQIFAMLRSQHHFLTGKLAQLPKHDPNYENLELSLRFSASQQKFFARLREVDPVLLNLMIKRDNLGDIMDILLDHSEKISLLRASKRFALVNALGMEAKTSLVNAAAKNHADLRVIFAKPILDASILAITDKILALSTPEDACTFIIECTKNELRTIQLLTSMYEQQAIQNYSRNQGPIFKKQDKLDEYKRKAIEIRLKFQESITPIVEKVNAEETKQRDACLAFFKEQSTNLLDMLKRSFGELGIFPETFIKNLESAESIFCRK